MAGLHEREQVNLHLSDADQLMQLEQKNEKVYEFFNKDMMMGLPHNHFN